MTAFLVITYDIADESRFADYSPGSGPAIMATIDKHGGSLLASSLAEAVVGTANEKCVILSFPDVDAAKAWQDDDEYAPLKAIRYEATQNITEMVVPGR